MKLMRLIIGIAAACLIAAPAMAQTTIRVMTWNPTHTAGNAWWDKITGDFSAKHPGVTIEGDFVPFNQYLTTLSAMTAGGSLPDIFWGNVKTIELGKAGIAMDYTKVLDKSFLDQFFPSTLQQFTNNGAVYALPGNAQMFGLFVNDAQMKKLGLQFPNTWDELIDMAPKIRAAGLTPLAFGNLAKNVCPDFFLPIIAQYGGDVYALDAFDRPDVSWNSPPVINALKLMKRLVDAHVFLDGINGVGEQPAWQIAYEGKALMLFTNTSAPATFESQAPKAWLENYSVEKMPAVTADGVHYAGDGSGRGFVINANGPNKDLALEFLKYFFSPDVYKYLIAETKDFPSMPAALTAVTNDKVKTMASWLTTDGADHILFGAGDWDAVSNVCQGILDGSITPEEGAKQIQDTVKEANAAQ